MSRWLGPLAAMVVLAINVAHPFIHHLEGGSLDAAIQQLDVIATYWAMHR